MDKKFQSPHFRKTFLVILGLTTFISFLSFKPSEPYLSETQREICSSYDQYSCKNEGCMWLSSGLCQPTPCGNLTLFCGDATFFYCSDDGNGCAETECYKNFSENQVNNDIYPWSTYAYLPFLLVLGPFAEIYSYRVAILFGISGRVATRFLLLFGSTTSEMQIMQVTYSMGTAAEDVFAAYVYYVVPPDMYQEATSYIKAAAMVAFVLSGVLGDVLVTQAGTSLNTLMVISAVFVTMGFAIGFFVIKKVGQGGGFLDPSLLSETSGGKDQIHANIEDVDRIALFREQMGMLWSILQSTAFKVLLLWWIIGNAVFTILYGYEVSIYIELSGTNEWNGSVLSIMLLAGTVGALAPAWIGAGSLTGRRTSRWLVAMGLISSAALVLFVVWWDLVASTAFLTVFFASWQFINVVFYARLAMALKAVQHLHRWPELPASGDLGPLVQAKEVPLLSVADVQVPLMGWRSARNSAPCAAIEHALETTTEQSLVQLQAGREGGVDPPYSVAVVAVVAASVVVQVVVQAILFSGLEMELREACFVMVWLFCASTVVYVFFCTLWYCGNSIGHEVTDSLSPAAVANGSE